MQRHNISATLMVLTLIHLNDSMLQHAALSHHPQTWLMATSRRWILSKKYTAK